MRMRKCPECRERFQPVRQMQPCCDKDACRESFAIRHIEATRKRARMKESAVKAAERKETKAKLEKLKPLSYWADKAQNAVNSYIRARDAGQPCISCGRHHAGKVNAGHYRSRGAMAALRYHHDNIHLQCEPCNTSKSGNQLEYRIRLIRKIGIERVEWLEGPHDPPRWRKEDYQRIEQEHKQLLKELRK